MCVTACRYRLLFRTASDRVDGVLFYSRALLTAVLEGYKLGFGNYTRDSTEILGDVSMV